MEKYYTCIALDVQKSRDYNLQKVEEVLIKLERMLNHEFNQQMFIPFKIRRGDEIVGVAKRFKDAYYIIQAIDHWCENNTNITFYIGCGFGRIDTSNKYDIDVVNGSSIINALHSRDEILKKGAKEAKVWENKKLNKVYYFSNDIPHQIINSSFYFIRNIVYNRSDKQKEIIKAVEEHPQMSYEQIGQLFGYKSPKTSVSNHLYAANYDLSKISERSLVQLLDYYQNTLESL